MRSVVLRASRCACAHSSLVRQVLVPPRREPLAGDTLQILRVESAGSEPAAGAGGATAWASAANEAIAVSAAPMSMSLFIPVLPEEPPSRLCRYRTRIN